MSIVNRIGSQQLGAIYDAASSQYSVTFTPTERGNLELAVSIDGQPIAG